MDTQTTFNLLSPVSLAHVAMLTIAAVVLLLLARAVFGPPLGPSRRLVLWVVRGLILLVLVAILANPVRVDRSPGELRRSDVSYLLDTSSSMALGEGTSRFDEAIQMMQDVDRAVPPEKRPDLSTYRFGQRFSAVDSLTPDDAGSIAPTDHDTQLLSALRQLTGRFIGSRHHLVVLFSDGRSREPVGVQEMARRYAELGAPIHVVPLGETDRGGDVAVVNMVTPARVRKYSQVGATVWVRSYGYDGVRAEVRLEAIGQPDQQARPLAHLPITLSSGVQSFNLTFQSDLETTRVKASVPLQSNEVSTNNNAVTGDIAVDRTKIRVLYIEGAGQQISQRVMPDGRVAVTGPHSTFHRALSEDPDIECVPLLSLSDSVGVHSVVGGGRGFPETRAQLFAYDAIIVSDMARGHFTDEQLALIDDWISQRGAGLCMAGGPKSFADGGWAESTVAGMLPVTFATTGRSWSMANQLSVRPDPGALRHPLWNIVSDAKRNESILASVPKFTMVNRGNSAKQAAQVLATGRFGDVASGTSVRVLVVGSYGKGRTMAAMVSLNPQWSPEFATRWGENDNRYYAKFWRNAIYWLTEKSYLGRRRLVVTSDRMSYQPGQAIKLTARAFDETSRPTTNCRVTVMIEPQSLDADLDSDYAPVRWPNGVARPSDETSPYVVWGEELDMLAQPDQRDYVLELPLADRLSGGAGAEALRVELSAYEDYTLIDSTSIDVQVLDDPFEHRNPLPDLALMDRTAELSGGRVFTDADSLAAMLRDLPVEIGPEKTTKVPLWSRWWLLGLLLVLLTAEWAWRRNLGLA